MKERPLLDTLTNGGVSSVGRYLQIFVGNTSCWSLLKYETITSVLGPLPGALGYVLRGLSYPWLLGQSGRGTMFGRSMVLRCPGRITIGNHVLIDDHVVLDAKGDSSRIDLGDRILIGRHCILSCNEATIRIGDSASVGPFCFFAAKGDILIGANVSIGSKTQLMAGTHASDDPDLPINRQARIASGIVVEDNVWIGSGATILDGVTIGRNSIVGVDAVVTKDVPPWTTVFGNPARVIQKRKTLGESL